MKQIKQINKRYDPLEAENRIKKHWQDEKIFQFDAKSTRPIFSIDTPPPYVSAAHLHIGHAMSYIQGEIIARHRRMTGNNVFYPMGFDDNGLPTERYVEKKNKINKRKISRSDFIKLCIDETRQGAKNYREIWEQLGVSVDWSQTYSTIGSMAQRIAQKSFLDLYKRDLIYRKQAPNLWCTHCQTAIAQADLEDLEEKSEIYYLLFLSADTTVEIATTRPEMLPACVGVYVNPEDSRYKALIGRMVKIPIFGYEVPIIASQTVDISYGTGAMMVCTWGDGEDVLKWMEDGLNTRVLIAPDGRLTDIGLHFAGMTIIEARQKILLELREKGILTKSEPITHKINVHERCNTPVGFNYSWQWYVKVLEQKNEWIRRCEELNWQPNFMKVRMLDWIHGLKWDWCISRDRYYGVPFPLWYCEQCKTVVIADKNLLPVDPREQSSPNNCPNCRCEKLNPENQVMDTWMTSSLTPLINARWGEPDDITNKIYPMNLRIQGFEIIRTWLFYTIVKSHFHTNQLPWRSTMISGWGLDQSGKKMSKSLGNFVKIEDTIKHYGADAIRWWATTASLGKNLRYSDEDLRASRKLIDKLWSVARFCQQHIYNEPSVLCTFADTWILAELQETVANVGASLETYDYNKARIHLEKFFWQKFCDMYLELCKDRTWNPEKYTTNQLSSLRFAISTSLLALLKLFAPFLPFVTEEIYSLLYGQKKSIHLENWPQVDESFCKKNMVNLSDELIEVIGKIRHFKTNFAPSLRAEISLLCINTENVELQQAGNDLMVLANAKQLRINDLTVEGQNYETKKSTIILVL